MNFIEAFENNTNAFTKKIKDSSYLEGNIKVKVKGVDDISEVIIGENEITYESMEKEHKKQFIVNKKLEIASTFKKDDKYNRKFSVSLIQNGFQNKNYLSSILYLNIYYKIHCVIYNENTGKYYQTTMKDYPKLICCYKDDKWMKIDGEENENLEYSDIGELSNILTLDIDWLIYKPYLSSLSKYKVGDLETIAKENEIDLKNSKGKKKTKKELYDSINLKYFKQDI